MQEDTLVAQRLVCDLTQGIVTKVHLTKELLSSVASARSRDRLYFETRRKKKESLVQGQKRKATEDYLEELKQSRNTIQTVSGSLSRDADRFCRAG